MSKEEKTKIEIELHIAEYNALTSRCTYHTNTQIVLLTAVIALAGALIYSWPQDIEKNYPFRWAILGGIQILGIISARIFHAEYNIICYIEQKLRPKITELLTSEAKDDNFWNYQTFLTNDRTKWYTFLEYSGIFIAAVSIIFIGTTMGRCWFWYDTLGIILNVILFLIMTINTYITVKIRKNNWEVK